MAKKTKQKRSANEVRTYHVYALRHIKSGKLLQMERSSNAGSDFCNDTTVRLSHCHSNDDMFFDPDVWYAEEAWMAEWVRQNSTEWYNSSERSPKHGYEPEELEIIEITGTMQLMQTKTTVPTFLEFAEIKYKDKEKDHLAYLKREYKKNAELKYSRGQNFQYSLWELMMLIENGQWEPEGDNNGRSDTSKDAGKKKV